MHILGRYITQKQIFIFPCSGPSQDKKALPTGEYIFGTTFHIKQKQTNRSRGLKKIESKKKSCNGHLIFQFLLHI